MKNNNNKIVISDIYRCKNKQSFFALHQIHSKIKAHRPDVEVEFHILWDNNPEGDVTDLPKWESLIDTYGFNIVSYDRQFFIDYAVSAYDIPIDELKIRLSKFFPLYLILMAHYLRRVKLYDYYLIYDDDILINYDFVDVIDSLIEKKPVLITEPYHTGCDKVLFKQLIELFGKEFTDVYLQRNPEAYGFNAGFQGIDLRMYDHFLSSSGFITLLNLFEYKDIFDENGNEIISGYARTQIETQQQSFFGLLNTVMAKHKPYILDPKTAYVAPNFGYCELHGQISEDDGYDGWGVCLNSKISHFIGATFGKGKTRQFLDRVDDYLKFYGFID